MFNLPKPLKRMFIVAGLTATAALAGAVALDGQIKVDKALNSPTLTIRYSNANAALVELRVNGESVGTRSMSSAKSVGETTFDLNLASLKGGDNEVEVVLYDKSGKQIGSEKTLVTADQASGPVFLSNPKMGATINGNVEIKVGFGADLKNSYVSFFIDNQFKSISNVAPFSFYWDTQKESNGWHEVEAWVVDENSTTFKTKKVRVFIDNPRGRTERRIETPAVDKTPTPAQPVEKTAPAVKPVAGEMDNPLVLKVGGASLSKPARIDESTATGPQMMTPTGQRNVKPKLALQQKGLSPTIANSVTSSTHLVSITKGQRLPNIGAYAIVFNSSVVKFDVAPRVEDGVPLTPFRHLVEKAGGKVEWTNAEKTVSAQADGKDIFFKIGDKIAMINKLSVELERASYIDSGRAIVPLSFMRDALNVNIDYDKATGHVLITSLKK